ncbi:hypothetical protein JYT51_00370 [Candidatus Amoebophilus asiaticus]|nr:hypothetical protein [Candidatus Amoebophilus asiaticus]
MENHLHIISFAIPYPPNYGGVIDVYYLLKALKEQDVKIHLHCFQYNRGPSKYLKELCFSVNYYQRKSLKRYLFHSLPFIVASRKSDELLKNLLKDEHPILFEGLHSCSCLANDNIKRHLKIVRTQNVEHDYYLQLAKIEKDVFKKYFFYSESYKLAIYEKILQHADLILAISKNDHKHFKSKFGGKASLMRAYHPFSTLKCKTGKGEYALYHGNLSVGENNRAALFLVQEVFNGLSIPLIIAGMNPSRELKKAVEKSDNITLQADLPEDEMHELIINAHINILPTFQQTGIKLKLLCSLYLGRFCVVNSAMVVNTDLEQLCTIADTPDKIKESVVELSRHQFTEEEKNVRAKILKNNFSNAANAQNLVELLFNN